MLYFRSSKLYVTLAVLFVGNICAYAIKPPKGLSRFNKVRHKPTILSKLPYLTVPVTKTGVRVRADTSWATPSFTLPGTAKLSDLVPDFTVEKAAKNLPRPEISTPYEPVEPAVQSFMYHSPDWNKTTRLPSTVQSTAPSPFSLQQPNGIGHTTPTSFSLKQLSRVNPAQTIAPEVERQAAQARADHYGMVPWTQTHQHLLTPSNYLDDPLYFDQWYFQNQHALMVTQETTVAFEALQKAVHNGTPDDETYRILDKLYSMQLGMQHPSELFMSLTYRGDDPALPLAKYFHPVIKINGITLPSMKKIFKLKAMAPHIRFSHDEQHIKKLVLMEGVTTQEIDQVVRELTPEGYTVRMSPHEFGIQNDLPTRHTLSGTLHLHIEKIQPDGSTEPDISYILYISAHNLVNQKKPHQIMKIYRNWFWQYMDNYMRHYTLPQRRVHDAP